MSLPVNEQRALDRIENALEGEPQLRSMFAIFTRLTRDDAVPPTEALRARTRVRLAWPASGVTAAKMRAIITVPVILGLITLCIFMAINSSGAQGCRPGPVLARTVSCQSAPGPARSSASRGG